VIQSYVSGSGSTVIKNNKKSLREGSSTVLAITETGYIEFESRHEDHLSKEWSQSLKKEQKDAKTFPDARTARTHAQPKPPKPPKSTNGSEVRAHSESDFTRLMNLFQPPLSHWFDARVFHAPPLSNKRGRCHTAPGPGLS